jgi:hypothetical protein
VHNQATSLLHLPYDLPGVDIFLFLDIEEAYLSCTLKHNLHCTIFYDMNHKNELNPLGIRKKYILPTKPNSDTTTILTFIFYILFPMSFTDFNSIYITTLGTDQFFWIKLFIIIFLNKSND